MSESRRDAVSAFEVVIRDVVEIDERDDQRRLTKLEAQTRAARVPDWNECPACGSLLTEPLHRSPDGHGLKYLRCTICKQQWAPRES